MEEAGQESFTDKIGKVLDYEVLIKKIENYLRKKKYQLIETLAREIGKLILAEQLADDVTISVHKTKLLQSKSIGVEFFFKKS